ncbi:hypothetical protein MRX96_047821 [Rhipicephalus microplus]
MVLGPPSKESHPRFLGDGIRRSATALAPVDLDSTADGSYATHHLDKAFHGALAREEFCPDGAGLAYAKQSSSGERVFVARRSSGQHPRHLASCQKDVSRELPTYEEPCYWRDKSTSTTSTLRHRHSKRHPRHLPRVPPVLQSGDVPPLTDPGARILKPSGYLVLPAIATAGSSSVFGRGLGVLDDVLSASE